MHRKLTPIICLFALVATSATAQMIEIAPFIGYRTGASANIDSGDLSKIKISGDVNYGFMFDIMFSEDAAFEFQWGRQPATLSARLTGSGMDTELFDVNSDRFQFNFLYHWGEMDSQVRPFIGGGLGWTRFGPKDRDDLDAVNKFAYNIGGGVKAYFSDNFGVRFDAKYAPTYVTSEDRLWCDPFFCYRVPDNRYFNQFEFDASIIIRF